MKKYILEFSEQQQQWHYNDGRLGHNPKWKLVMKDATQLEMETFELYVRSKNENHYTFKMVIELLLEFKSFVTELEKNGLIITEKIINKG